MFLALKAAKASAECAFQAAVPLPLAIASAAVPLPLAIASAAVPLPLATALAAVLLFFWQLW